jgi:hypothetical protein
MNHSKAVRITLELEPGQAAGLLRYADKIGHSDAMGVLYGHLTHEMRSEQASEILTAFSRLEMALLNAGVCSFPWIETGQP